jgi:signal transduction histidine kinase
MKISGFELAKEQQLADKALVEQRMDEILSRLREISFDLMPYALLRKGLVGAIEQLISFINRTNTIDIALVTESAIELPQQKTINIFRIVHEILHNAIKHSKATAVLISVDKKGQHLEIKIADNGIGFDYDQELNETTGFGLRSIQNRTESMGGNLFVQSEKGKGLSYIIEIPLT